MTRGDLNEPSLTMSCETEDVTPEQKIFYEKKAEEHRLMREKLNEFVTLSGSTPLYVGNYLTVYQTCGASPDLEALNAKELEKFVPAPPKPKIPKGYVTKRTAAAVAAAANEEIELDDDDDDEDLPLAKRKAAIKKSVAKAKEKEKSDKKSVGSTARPTENTAVGGLSVGSATSDAKKKEPSAVVDLTKDDGKPVADSREVETFRSFFFKVFN